MFFDTIMTRSNTEVSLDNTSIDHRSALEHANKSKMLDKPHPDPIHSGHFMLTRVHDESTTDDEDDQLPTSPIMAQSNDDDVVALGYNFINANKMTSHTYRFGEKGTNAMSIDASLTKLFECMTLAYSGKLTSPKWKAFKGMNLTPKMKVRLNNIIWREWHMQFIQKKNAMICQFATPLSDDFHRKAESVVLEGKYWKRRLQTVTSEYKKWRSYHRNSIHKSRSEASMCDTTMNLETPSMSFTDESVTVPRIPRSATPSLAIDDDYFMDFSDTLFSTLNQTYPFPSSKDMAQLGNADFIQPGLMQLQPNFDDFMDTMETLPDIFGVNNNDMVTTTSQASSIIPYLTDTRQLGGQVTSSILDTAVQQIRPTQSLNRVDEASGSILLNSNQTITNQPSAMDTINSTQLNTLLLSPGSGFQTQPHMINLVQTIQQQQQQQPQQQVPQQQQSTNFIKVEPDLGSLQFTASHSRQPQQQQVSNTYTTSLLEYALNRVGSGSRDTGGGKTSAFTVIQQPLQQQQQQTVSLHAVQSMPTLQQQQISNQSQFRSNSLPGGDLFQPIVIQQSPPTQKTDSEFAIPKGKPIRMKTTRNIAPATIKPVPVASATSPRNLLAQLLTSDTYMTSTPKKDDNLAKHAKSPTLIQPAGLKPPPSRLSSLSDNAFQKHLIIGAANQALGTSARTNEALVNCLTSQPLVSNSQTNEVTRSPSVEPIATVRPKQTTRSKTNLDRRQYREHRRSVHISSEQKRRYNIKHGFDTLNQLIPALHQNPNPKISKAAMLQKAAEYCQKLKTERSQMQNEADLLRKEIESINSDINVCQAQLPASGVPVTRQRADQMKEMFDDYKRKRTIENWKFWIFSQLFDDLFTTFNNTVSTASIEELCRTAVSWLDQHCSLVALRPAVSNSFRHLSTTTSILSEPDRVPEQAIAAVTKRASFDSGGS
ncbi:MLX-interacting protein-like isoform X2 [Tubulanus polymorphus]|uniref:MLX-interacting protein-like isoform X2 n=1 Tax=Tubulanus polymorphus TaxID=672921 RepID=UPI003DA3C808